MLLLCFSMLIAQRRPTCQLAKMFSKSLIPSLSSLRSDAEAKPSLCNLFAESNPSEFRSPLSLVRTRLHSNAELKLVLLQ